MQNNKKFLAAFNKIEDFLIKESRVDHNASFHFTLAKVSKENEIVNYYKEDLNDLRKLRNFIVHGDIDKPLAIVSKETVERAIEIEKALMRPTKIREIFKENVTSLNANDSLKKALLTIKEKGYSQFPVIDKNGFRGIITESGIVSWLANNIEDDKIIIKDKKIKEVMINDKKVDSYKLLYNYNTLYDVIDAFEKNHNINKRSFTIIVLKRKSDKIFEEDIYTLLTAKDLNKIYKSLGLDKE